MTGFVLGELDRIIDQIPKTDPSTVEYHTLLASMELIAQLEETFDAVLSVLGRGEDDEGKIINVEFRPPVVGLDEGHTCDEDCATCDICSSNSTESVTAGENPPEKVDSSAETPSENVEEHYDLVTVRKALVDARKAGIDVGKILRSCGASNLTDLAEDQFAAVMAKLKEIT